MSLNEICPHCKEAYMEPMMFTMAGEFFHGTFKCPFCRKESVVVNIGENLIYDYPFEGK